MINGAETKEGTIYATDDEELKRMVLEADRYHNDEFQPPFQDIYDLLKQKLSSKDSNSSVLSMIHQEVWPLELTMVDIVGLRCLKGLGCFLFLIR